MPTSIRLRLADVVVTYRDHELELPETCPECAAPLAWRLRPGEELPSEGAPEVVSRCVVTEAGGELEWGDNEFLPAALRCAACAHEFAAGEFTVD